MSLHPNLLRFATILLAVITLSIVFQQQATAAPFPKDSVKSPTPAAKFVPDEKMLKAWNAFAQAVKTNNIKALKAMATGCVYCNYCLFNSDKENQNYVDSMKKNGDLWTLKVNNELQYLPAEKFLNEDLADIFPAAVKAKLTDKSNLAFKSGESNRKTFNKFCISDHPISSNPKFFEVHILDHSGKVGLSKIFTFTETNTGYKFCGYSITP